MTPQEFLYFLNSSGGSVTSPPTNPFKDEWEKIKRAIEPHFYGDVPAVLRKAFPNEDPEIADYRKQIYQAKTMSPVEKAKTELLRLISSSKHSIYFDNQDMQQWYEDTTYMNKDIFSYFFDVVVPFRILDPNGVVLIEPTGPGLDSDAFKVDIMFSVLQSARVIFNDPDYPLLIYKDTTKPKYTTSVSSNITGIYYVVTDMFYGKIDGQKFEVIYEHNSGIRPWFTFGGRAIPKYDQYGNQYIVYQSDFSPAVPYLNDAAIFDNQDKSIMLSSGFPLRFTPGIACDGCAGVGWYYDQAIDERNTCKLCAGTGKKIAFSPLGAYNVVEPPAIVGPEDAGKSFPDPIKYYSPDPSILQTVTEKAKAALEKAEQVLNINRSLISAQSGVAKELDREPEYIEIAKISNAIYAHLRHTLRVIQALRFMDTESIVTVNEPVSFSLKSEVELMAEFAETQKGSPDSVRYEAFLRLVNERYAQDKTARKLAEICADYTIFVLYTTTELNERLAAGTIVKGDIVKSQYVYQAVSDLYYSHIINVFTDDFNSIRKKIDEYLAPIIESLGVVNIEDMDDLDLNDDPEL